ncbi:hypothetical protein DRO49_04655, partial [Candidatus Bathyarchaeota archaeon]
VQVYREACHFFETAAVWDPAPLLNAPAVPELNIDSRGKSDEEVLAEAVAAVYDLAADDAALRAATVTGKTERAKNFDRLRAEYSARREFSNTQVGLTEARPEVFDKLRLVGFRVRT